MALIEIRNLSKTFQQGEDTVTALKDITLSIEAHSIFGIIGMSGAGKSTLVRCINFLERPTTGTVVVSGKNLGELSDRDLREARYHIGMIFQNFNLMMQAKVIDNVMFPLLIRGADKEFARKKAMELLAVVELQDKANAYPATLSGGQKQRVAIARTMTTNPEILLCDEATSALDPKTTDSILRLLQEINQKYGTTIVIITHEMSIVEKICTDVAILSNSELAESGKVSEVFSNPMSEVGKQLILSGRGKAEQTRIIGKRSVRIVFDGTSPYEPIVANLVLETGAAINILYANTAEVSGAIKGHMVVQLPEDEEKAESVLAYLRGKKIVVQEL